MIIGFRTKAGATGLAFDERGKGMPLVSVIAWVEGPNRLLAYYSRDWLEALAQPGTKFKHAKNQLDAEKLSLFNWGRSVLKKGLPLPHKEAIEESGLDRIEVPYSSPMLRAGYGGITYDGWKVAQKKSAHSFEKIHETIENAVASTIAAWPGWFPLGLRFKFHGSQRVMGFAYDPGRHVQLDCVRLISLNNKLLENYDLPSLWRVVVHELAHHHRDESFPNTGDAHDEIFCQILAAVDPIVGKDPGSCRYFKDDVDYEVAEKTVAARTGNRRVGPEYGYLEYSRIKSGALRMTWRPWPGQDFKALTEPMTDDGLLLLIKHLITVPELKAIKAVSTDPPLKVRLDPGNTQSLETVLRNLVRLFPQNYRKVAGWLRSVDIMTEEMAAAEALSKGTR